MTKLHARDVLEYCAWHKQTPSIWPPERKDTEGEPVMCNRNSGTPTVKQHTQLQTPVNMGRLRTSPLVSLSLLLLCLRFLPPHLPTSFVAARCRPVKGPQPGRSAGGAVVLEPAALLDVGEAHAVPEKDILDFFNVTLEQGLSEEQVKQQMDEYGANQLLEPEKKSLWELVAEQFDDLLVRILLLSALVSFLLAYFNSDQKEEGLSAYIEPLVILMILVLNACVGVWQESNAEKALVSSVRCRPCSGEQV